MKKNGIALHEEPYCYYTLLTLNSISQETPYNAEEEGDLDPFHTVQVMFYKESFIIQFAEIISFFYKKEDQIILARLMDSPAELKDLYTANSELAQVIDFERTIKVIENKLDGSDINLLIPCGLPRGYHIR